MPAARDGLAKPTPGLLAAVERVSEYGGGGVSAPHHAVGPQDIGQHGQHGDVGKGRDLPCARQHGGCLVVRLPLRPGRWCRSCLRLLDGWAVPARWGPRAEKAMASKRLLAAVCAERSGRRGAHGSPVRHEGKGGTVGGALGRTSRALRRWLRTPGTTCSSCAGRCCSAGWIASPGSAGPRRVDVGSRRRAGIQARDGTLAASESPSRLLTATWDRPGPDNTPSAGPAAICTPGTAGSDASRGTGLKSTLSNSYAIQGCCVAWSRPRCHPPGQTILFGLPGPGRASESGKVGGSLGIGRKRR